MRHNLKFDCGITLKIGDIVRLNQDELAVVVGLIERGEFIDGFIAKDWAYLKNGVLIKSAKIGLIHYPDDLQDVVFIRRATTD